METEIKFKFQPGWIIFIYILLCPLIFEVLLGIIGQELDLSHLLMSLPLVLLLYYLLPITFKMFLGTPALALSKDYFIDNLGNHSIKWHDISQIKFLEGRYRGFNKLVINLKQPEKYFNTPLKKLLYKFRQIFTANDIGILLDFVSGKDAEIMQVINAYWDKSAGL